MFLALVLTTALSADPEGWDALFPALDNFGRKVDAPKVEKGDPPAAYRQSATYEWTGGRFEVLTVTLARDPKFQERYAPDAMKKEKAEKLEIGKRPAYLWDRMKADQLDEVNRRLVVVLAGDKILMIEQRGSGLELAAVAQKIDLEKALKALDGPPAKPK